LQKVQFVKKHEQLANITLLETGSTLEKMFVEAGFPDDCATKR
jgi:hypothetical protein